MTVLQIFYLHIVDSGLYLDLCFVAYGMYATSRMGVLEVSGSDMMVADSAPASNLPTTAGLLPFS